MVYLHKFKTSKSVNLLISLGMLPLRLFPAAIILLKPKKNENERKNIERNTNRELNNFYGARFISKQTCLTEIQRLHFIQQTNFTRDGAFEMIVRCID